MCICDNGLLTIRRAARGAAFRKVNDMAAVREKDMFVDQVFDCGAHSGELE
jgi:hypothetical protein